MILKTPPGHANAIAFYIDQEKKKLADSHPLHLIAGTIAGDDTIFVAVQDQKSLSQLQEFFQNFFQITL